MISLTFINDLNAYANLASTGFTATILNINTQNLEINKQLLRNQKMQNEFNEKILELLEGMAKNQKEIIDLMNKREL